MGRRGLNCRLLLPHLNSLRLSSEALQFTTESANSSVTKQIPQLHFQFKKRNKKMEKMRVSGSTTGPFDYTSQNKYETQLYPLADPADNPLSGSNVSCQIQLATFSTLGLVADNRRFG